MEAAQGHPDEYILPRRLDKPRARQSPQADPYSNLTIDAYLAINSMAGSDSAPAGLDQTVMLRRHAQAFTLVEVLIVVLILSILAAIAVPRMAKSSQDANEAVLHNNLQIMRAQVEIYTIQHDGLPPGKVNAGGRLGGRWSGTLFVNQLLSKTDILGQPTSDGEYGPYLQRIPANPYANSAMQVLVRQGSPNDNGYGWTFDPNTGDLRCNDAAHAEW